MALANVSPELQLLRSVTSRYISSNVFIILFFALHISCPLTGHFIFCRNSLKSLHDGYRRSDSFTNIVPFGRNRCIFRKASRPGPSLSRKACTFSYLERKSFERSTMAVELSTHTSSFLSAGNSGWSFAYCLKLSRSKKPSKTAQERLPSAMLVMSLVLAHPLNMLFRNSNP